MRKFMLLVLFLVSLCAIGCSSGSTQGTKPTSPGPGGTKPTSP